jgi:hypothetical protein
MSIYALGQRSGETYDAAGKAIGDVYTILKEFGAKVIWNVPKKCHKIVKILDFPYLVLFLLFRVGKKDYVFFSIPENGQKIWLVAKIRKLKHYQVVCFINDINAFRYGAFDSPVVQEKMKQEIALIATADTVVAPNENTVELFRTYGVQSKMAVTGVWDYLNDGWKGNAEEGRAGKDDMLHIAFAGNLNKSDFLLKLKHMEGIQFELWGKLEEERKAKLPACCNYHGVLPAEEVPEAIRWCDMGLVWDGTGEDTIAGGLGEYLRYNNSHKCGLYLASDLPVIVWKESGMANFVERMQCGLAIERLQQIPECIAGCDLHRKKENAKKAGQQIRRGEFLHRAFQEAFGTAGK